MAHGPTRWRSARLLRSLDKTEPFGSSRQSYRYYRPRTTRFLDIVSPLRPLSPLLNMLELPLPSFQSLTGLAQERDGNFKKMVLQDQSRSSKIIAEFTQLRLDTIKRFGSLLHHT